jgi:hypothetical protein
LLGKKIVKDMFEEAGNYVYCIFKREIKKVALGLNLKTVAFKGLNVSYIKGVEFEKRSPDSKLFKKVKMILTFYDFLCKIKVKQPGLLTAIIFKQLPNKEIRKELISAGYEVVDLPLNPYV